MLELDKIMRPRIQKIIQDSGETMYGFAKNAGIEYSTLSRYLDGKNKGKGLITPYRVALYSGVSLDWIVGLTKSKPNTPPCPF